MNGKTPQYIHVDLVDEAFTEDWAMGEEKVGGSESRKLAYLQLAV